MKKIILLFTMILLSFYSFSWEKIQRTDDFGDATTEYIIGEELQGLPGGIFIGKEDDQTVAYFGLIGGKFDTKKISVNVKGKDGVVNKFNCLATEKFIYFTPGQETKKFIQIIRDSDIVKIHINKVPFSFKGGGFTKLYKESYYQKFDDKNKIKKPEGIDENKIWETDIWLK